MQLKRNTMVCILNYLVDHLGVQSDGTICTKINAANMIDAIVARRRQCTEKDVEETCRVLREELRYALKFVVQRGFVRYADESEKYAYTYDIMYSNLDNVWFDDVTYDGHCFLW